jgi:hypothetical protein
MVAQADDPAMFVGGAAAMWAWVGGHIRFLHVTDVRSLRRHLFYTASTSAGATDLHPGRSKLKA